MKAPIAARTCMPPPSQRGAAAVEFALIASLLFMLLFGLVELSRVMAYLNTAAEATRLGARLAVVCSMDDSTIKQRIGSLFPLLTSEKIDVTYKPDGCSATTCTQVRVRIAPGTEVRTFIPFIDFSPNLPDFETILPRESMNSTSNPVCE